MTHPTTIEQKSLWQVLDRATIALLALQLLGGVLLSPHFAFFPLYIKDLGYSAILIANIAAAKQAAGLIASLVGGSLSDSLGRKRTLLLGNIGYLVSSFAFLIVSPNWIGLVWAIGGFGMGLHTLGGQSYLMDAAAPNFLGLISALYNWGYTLGGALGSPMVGLILDRWDHDILAVALIGLAACTIALNQFVLPRSPVAVQSHTPRLKRFFGYGEVAMRPTVLTLAALRFLPTLYYATTLILVPLLLDAAGASNTTVAWYATVSSVVASLAQGVVGRAADRSGPAWPTALTFGVLIISAFGTALWPSNSGAVLTFGTTGLAAAWALSTLLPILVSTATAPEERGRVLGFIHLWWNLAMIVGSMVGGVLFEIASGLPFLTTGIINLVSLALLFVFYRLVAGSSHTIT
jgi:DHA1 family multidrug resistance protein-like MFS transporter